MTIDKPGQEQRMVTVDQVVEFVQDKLDNGGLTDGWWDNFDQEFRALLAAMHEVRPTADLGEDGDDLVDGPTGLRASARNIRLARQRGSTDYLAGWEANVADEAADRLILYREAREKLANLLLAGTLSMGRSMVHIDFETREDAEAMFEALGDVLSRSA